MDSTGTRLFADQGRKDIVSPTGERYFLTYSWEIDSTTLVPVGVKVEETH